MERRDNSLKCVIGIDGGGTKTSAALANLRGKILTIEKSGPSGPRNVGIRNTAKNIAAAVNKILKKNRSNKILMTFIGLAGVDEEFKLKRKKIKREILRHKEISRIFKGELKIEGDQIIAFRSGTDKKEGVLLISGTGSVCHGWKKGKEAKVSGWGYFNDEGSGIWAGRKTYEAIWKDLDGRGPKTLLTKLIFQSFKLKNKEDLIELIYSKNPVEIIPYFSIIADKAAKKGDKIAREIMKESGKELLLSANTVIKKLNFQKKRFPLVMVGGMFKSGIILDIVKKGVRKLAPRAEFILPKKEPVTGAVKLAIESLKCEG